MPQLVERFGLEDAVAKTVIEGVAGRAYSLLLGAGASYNVQGGDMGVLKGAVDLAEEINKLLGLGLEPPDSENLAIVYGDATQTSHTTRLMRFLEQRFTNCKPTWQPVLYEFNWKRIWSLNIDDVIERARPRTASSRLVVFNWTDDFKPRDRGEGELQLVHLHGMASRISSESQDLIFSLKEYAARSEALPGWHAEFRSEFSQKPFIVCGARLQEEYDLISVLEFGNRSSERGGAPSIAVLKSFASGQEARLRRFGLIPIAASGEDFFSALAADVREHLRASRLMDPAVVAGRNELRAAFRELQSYANGTATIRRKVLDYYASAEAKWGHICDDLDARLSIAESIVDWVVEPDQELAKVALITGGPISGKSSTLLRAAHDLLSRGQEVWLFRGEQLFAESAVIDYLKVKRSAVLILDDCADFSASIRNLISAAHAQSARVRIIAATENARRRALKGDTAGALVREFSQEPLAKADFFRIFQKRSSKARLGSATGMSKEECWRSFKETYGLKLLEWLEGLENATDYREAIRAILLESSGRNEVARRLLAATACVQRFGHSLPFFIASNLAGGQALESIVDEGGALSDIAYLDSTGIRVRNSAFAIFAWNCFSIQEKFDWSLNIARRVAPLVVPLSVTNRTIPYLIVRNLMDWENVYRDVGSMSERWYAGLESLYSWNARFWEQRALLGSEEGRDLMAYSYAKKAIAIHGRDPFPHTTLGKVCLKLAVKQDNQVAVDRFWEGVAALERSRQIAAADGLEWEHPYVTYFSYALKAARLPSFGQEWRRLASTWEDWMRAAESSGAFLNNSRVGVTGLEEFQRQWLLLSVNR